MKTEELVILSPGVLAIARRPQALVPDGFRVATAAELQSANAGTPFPWGWLRGGVDATKLWREKRVGVGGLLFERWFMTTEGRFGGAPEVPWQDLLASERYSLVLDGGGSLISGQLEPCEGWAVVREVSGKDRQMYRDVQTFAMQRVSQDRGGIAVSPICEDGIVRVGFLGRCQICPNPESITIKNLQSALPNYRFEFWPEWKGWSIY